MLIDIFFGILLFLALFKGYRKGLVLASFSFVGIFIGMAAALKFSAVVAGWLKQNTDIGYRWLPFLAFIIVLIAVSTLVHIAAKIIETSLEMVLLGWLNRLAGIVLYVLLYTCIFSLIIFFANKLHFITPDLVAHSKTYAYIEPVGPKCIAWLSKLLPFLQNSFQELGNFFVGLHP